MLLSSLQCSSCRAEVTGDILVLIPSSLEDLVTCFVTPENGQIVEQITAWMEANWLPASARVKGHLVAA